jgi:hypothetical protein
MKCSWGGCQTDAVVTITPADPTLSGGFDYTFDADQRAACRNHMAIICEEGAIHIVEALSVTDEP